MAISEDRLSSETIVSLTEVDYTTKQDEESNKASGLQESATKKSILDKAEPTPESTKDSASSIPENNSTYSTKSGMSAAVKEENAGRTLSRDATKKDTNKKNSLKNRFKNLPIDRNELNNNIESRLNKVVGAEVAGIILVGMHTPGNLADKVKAALIKSAGKYGIPIKNIADLLDLIQKCRNMDGYQIGMSPTAAIVTLASLIDELICKGILAIMEALERTLGITPDTMDTIIKALSISMNKNGDRNVLARLEILKLINNSSLSPTTKTILTAGTKNLTDITMGNIGQVVAFTAVDSLIDSMNVVNPNWNKDNDGNTSYYRTNGNSSFMSGATRNNENRVSMPTGGQGREVTTTVDPSLEIAAINAV